MHLIKTVLKYRMNSLMCISNKKYLKSELTVIDKFVDKAFYKKPG